jgi:uncharacterized Fe-S cluster-containing radical SAM superfamily protein
MYDPLELSKITEKLVTKGDMKKYYRFRPAKFYGGISTADTVGCNLRCKFCWSGNSVWNAKNMGEFYSPEDVAETLLNIAEAKGYNQIRISGGEPTIGKNHIINLLKCIYSDMVFILETNGVILGADKKYVESLSQFKNLHIRVCIKGIDPEEFQLLTGAKMGHEYQMKSLEYLRDSNVYYNIALVTTKTDIDVFRDRLTEMGLGKIMLEHEDIKLYPQVKNRLEKEGLIKYFE